MYFNCLDFVTFRVLHDVQQYLTQDDLANKLKSNLLSDPENIKFRCWYPLPNSASVGASIATSLSRHLKTPNWISVAQSYKQRKSLASQFHQQESLITIRLSLARTEYHFRWILLVCISFLDTIRRFNAIWSNPCLCVELLNSFSHSKSLVFTSKLKYWWNTG